MDTKLLFHTQIIASAVILMAFIASCSSTKEITKNETVTNKETSEPVEKASALQQLLNEQRSSLRDVYASQSQDMPAAFLKSDSTLGTIKDNPYEGYRIQIISSQSVQQADSVANQFKSWSDSTFKDYSPKTYILFQQPYYKVHIGDFQNSKRAYQFSKLIKNKYTGAWVVHDRINPVNVPADTLKFSKKK